MAFNTAFQSNAFQNNAFQIVVGQRLAFYQDFGFYGTEEDDQLKRRLEQVEEARRQLREWEEEERQRLRADVTEAYHYVPPKPPGPEPKIPRPPLLPPPAGPIDPWGLAQLMAQTQPELVAPPAPPAPLPPDPLTEFMQQAMAEVDQVMAELDSIDVDAMLANDPEYQSVMQMLERL